MTGYSSSEAGRAFTFVTGVGFHLPINASDFGTQQRRPVGSSSRQYVEQFPETRLVLVTLRALASGLDPFGMLDPQVVVNLLLELCVCVDLVRHVSWLLVRDLSVTRDGSYQGFGRIVSEGSYCARVE